MKRLLSGSLILCIVLMACEKKTDDTASERNTSSYFPLTQGSYWVYNSYEIDSLGNETLISQTDTIVVLYDTVINGEVFSVFYGKKLLAFNSEKIKKFYRDSAGYVINELGEVIFTSVNFTDTLYQHCEYALDEPVYCAYTMMKSYGHPINLPSGEFDEVLNCEYSINLNAHSAQTDYPSTQYLYTPGVGRILRQYYYMSVYEREKKYFEERLVEYHIVH